MDVFEVKVGANAFLDISSFYIRIDCVLLFLYFDTHTHIHTNFPRFN